MADEDTTSKSLANEAKLTEVLEDEILTLEVAPEENRRVLMKIDFILMPLLMGCYFLQNLDKNALNSSTMMGLTTDTHLHGKQFSWVSSIFYFGYLAWSFPAAYLMNRMPIGKYLGVTVVIWAIIIMCMAPCRNFSDLMAVRFLLGMAEASVAPAFTVITSMYYKREEQPLRQGIWFLGNGVSVIVASACAYGIEQWNKSLPNWKYLFIIYGGLTFGYGILMFFTIPDSPTKAWFLTTREKEVAVHRVLENKSGLKQDQTFSWDQGKEAFMDPQSWLLVLYTFTSSLPNGGIAAFGNYIINGFGYSKLKTLLMGSPAGGMMFGWVIFGALFCRYVKNTRIYVMIFYSIISVAGMSAVYATVGSDNKNGRLGAYYLVFTFASNFPFSLSLISSNVAGFSKKTVVSAMLFTAYCVGNLVGPQMFSESQAPKYKRGIAGALTGFVLCVISLILLRFYYTFENRRRDKLQANNPASDDAILDGLMNKTDRQNLGFRYVC